MREVSKQYPQPAGTYMDPPTLSRGSRMENTLRNRCSHGSCWIPGSWDLPMTYNPIVVTLSSLKPFFFNGLKKELCFSKHAWSIRPWNPLRALVFTRTLEVHDPL